MIYQFFLAWRQRILSLVCFANNAIQCSIQSAFLRDSRTKNHNDPQNRKQGVKNDPLPFLWKSQVFGPHKQNNDISHDIDYQELQTFMIQTK